MFKHILLPTDGSELSEKTAAQAIKTAKALGAKITAVHVMGGYEVMLANRYLGSPDVPDMRPYYDADMKARISGILDPVKKAALGAGVDCEALLAKGDAIYETILKQAQQSQCDLIMMASHGKSGINGVLLGSETQKVLTHAKIPVLVCK